MKIRHVGSAPAALRLSIRPTSARIEGERRHAAGGNLEEDLE